MTDALSLCRSALFYLSETIPPFRIIPSHVLSFYPFFLLLTLPPFTISIRLVISRNLRTITQHLGDHLHRRAVQFSIDRADSRAKWGRASGCQAFYCAELASESVHYH